MKNLATIILILLTTLHCGGDPLGLKEAASTLADALDGKCLHYLQPSETAEEADAEEDSEPCDTHLAGGESASDTDDDSQTSDTEGGFLPGVQTLPTSSKGTNRALVGTFGLQNYWNSCTSTSYNGYPMPQTVRVWSHDDLLDFEDSNGNLVWIARIFQDNTFDWSVWLADDFGRVNNQLSCTCTYDEGYQGYTPDSLNCSCAPTKVGDWTCEMNYWLK